MSSPVIKIDPVDGIEYMPDEKPDLETLQAWVDGLIEVVPNPGNPDTILIVNEEGLIKGLEPNYAASLVTGRAIFGTAVIMPDDYLE